jgi:hypothetical protein
MSIKHNLKQKFGVDLDKAIERFQERKRERFDYDNSALPAWGDNTMPDFITDLIENSDFLGDMTLEEGVKGYRDISLLNADITLRAKTGCNTSPDGSVVFTEKRLTTVLLQAGIEFCNEDLNGKITQILNVLGVKRQNGQLPAELEDILMAYLMKLLSKKAQDLVLKGDTASANAELNLMDGLIKIIYASSDVTVYPSTETAWTDANGYDIAKGLFKAIDTEILDNGMPIVMYMGRTEALTVLEQWNQANPYSQRDVPAQGTAMEFDLPLMPITIKTLPQLNGTGEAFVLPLSLTFLGTDELGDMEMEIKYDEYDDKLKAEASFRLGTQIVWDKYFTRLDLTTP